MFFHRVWNHRVDWVGRTLKITQLKIPWLHLWPVLRDTEPNLKIRIQNTFNQVLNAARCGQQDNVSCRKVCACGPVLCVPCCWTGREIFGWLRDWFFSLVPALIRDKAQLYLAVAGSPDCGAARPRWGLCCSLPSAALPFHLFTWCKCSPSPPLTAHCETPGWLLLPRAIPVVFLASPSVVSHAACFPPLPRDWECEVPWAGSAVQGE